MKFEKQQSNLHHRLYSHLIKIIPIQNQQRTKHSSYLTFSIYCFEYLLIFYIMVISQWQIFKIQYTSLSILLINVIRTTINLSYIITKFNIFVLLQRLCLGAHFLFFDHGQMMNYVALFVLDVLATGIWILTTQQRNTNFNSRLFLKYSLIKQLKIQIFSLLFILLKHNTKFNPMLFIIFSCVLLLIDFHDYIYYQKFKRMLIILDLYFVFVAILPIVFGTLGMVYDMRSCFVINGINLVAVCLYIYLSPLDFSMLFTVKPWTHNIQQHQILNYIICLDQLINDQNQHIIFNFIIYHIKNCKQSDCFLKFQHKIKQNDKKQTQILKVFKRQILLKFLKKYKILNQYLIFNYQNNYQKAIAKHDDKNFFHFRQNQQYFSNLDLSTGKTKKITTQFTNQFDLIPKITQFVDLAYEFWSQLLEYKINGSKIIKLGLRQLKIIKQIEQVVKKGYILTERSRITTNICLNYLINKKQNIAYQISTIQSVQNNFLGYDQAPPTFLISAQKQNFLKFTNANLAAVKISGYTKQQILSITADALWHKQIRQDHIFLAQKRAWCDRQGSGQLMHSYVYIKNKFGYAVVLDAIVYYYDSQEGKIWCVAMQTILDNQAVLIFNFNRQFVGMSQNCLAYGFRKDLQGQKITDDLLQASLNSKGGLKINNRRLFQDKQVHLAKSFTQDYILKYQTKIYFMGRPIYYIFTVNRAVSKRLSQQDTVNAIKLSYSSNKMLLKTIQKLSKTELQAPNNFQFNYQIMKNKYIGGVGIKNRFHQQNYPKINNVLCGDTSMDKSEPQMQNMPFQSIGDIIQMRYWDGNIDFIQNLQAVIPAFQSLPQYKLKQTQLSQNQIKQNYQIRISKISTNIKLIRVYGCILLFIVCSLLIYINVAITTNQDNLRYWLKSQQLSLKQLTKLSTISTILLKKYYNYDNTQLGRQLDILISQIDDIYGTIELTVQPLHYKIVKKTIQQYTLLQSDQVYRLLIKNYFNNPTIGINSILQHFLRYIERGWFEVIMNDYYGFQINSAAQIRGLFVFIGVTFLLAIVLVGVYLRIFDIINSTTQQLCDIFVSIQHKAIVNQVAKLQSFKDYMDYGNDLFMQQNQKQQNSDETKQQYPYPKRTVNYYRQKLPSILILLGSICFLTTLCTFTIQQCILQKSYKQTIDLHYVSQILTIEMKSIWIRLNTVPFSNQQIYHKISQLYEKHRNLQQLSMELIKNKDLEKLGQFTIQYIYGNICKQYLGQCNKQLSQSIKNGFKSVLASFILKSKRSINKYKNLEQFITWSQSNTMLYIDTQYISIIDAVIQEQIKEIFKTQVEDSKKIYGVYFSVFIIGLIFLLFWYRELTRRVVEVVELETILWCIPFKHLKNNWKYYRYLEKVKIIQR